jgi:hypothetical protein
MIFLFMVLIEGLALQEPQMLRRELARQETARD